MGSGASRDVRECFAQTTVTFRPLLTSRWPMGYRCAGGFAKAVIMRYPMSGFFDASG